ncbi:hypothetical protein C8R11_13019 [Nitrosomonas aestuarii]|nr:hypothetical protein C8R11_13019 [Nitrosomonas aestuarii]
MRKSPVCLFAFILPIVTGYDTQAHSLPLNKAAVESCQEKERSQACQYPGHHNDLYIGTCQYVTDEKLICVRNKPIQKIDSDTVDSETGHNAKHYSIELHNKQIQPTQ